MSAKAIYESKGKELLNKFLNDEAMKNRVAEVTEGVNWDKLTQENPWLLTEVGNSPQCFHVHILVITVL